MNKLNRFYVVCIALQLIAAGNVMFCFGQVSDASASSASEKVFCVQVAASKVFVEPDYFRQKLKLSENVGCFFKNGWYKYFIGTFKTESEATKIMAGLKGNGFVTSYYPEEIFGAVQSANSQKQPITDSMAEKKASIPDTSRTDLLTPGSPLVDESGLKQVYNRKIREADSAFNIEKNLVLARKLYLEASQSDPNKNYPKDQVVEIDKKLTEDQPSSIFSKLSYKFYIAVGFAVALIFMLLIFYLIRVKEKKDMQPKSGGMEENQEPVGGIAPEQSDDQAIILAEPATEIYKVDDDFLNSSNEILRLESELEFMRLNTDDPFSFLSQLRQDFTPLEQLHVFELAKRNLLLTPDFSRWLNSPNESVVSFCQRMIIAFEQDDDYPMEDGNVRFEKGPVEIKHPDILDGKPAEDIQSVALRILDKRIQNWPETTV